MRISKILSILFLCMCNIRHLLNGHGGSEFDLFDAGDIYNSDPDEESLNRLQSKSTSIGPSDLSFNPKKLFYRDAPALLPTVTEFVVHNLHESETVNIFAVISNSTQFHPVMFQPQILPPKSSVSLQLMFLPYYVETISSVLTVLTSVGDINYHVAGTAVPNPYRLHPFLGHRIPAGVQFYDQPILIYNPYTEPLHIREIFTTEQFMSLRSIPMTSSGSGSELCDSSNGDCSVAVSNEGPTSSALPESSSSWMVGPGMEKEVIILSMAAKLPGMYQGYVHIVTDRDKIVLPVELHALEGGLYARPEFLDFGVLTAVSEQKKLNIWLLNSGSANIRVIDIVPVSPDPQLHIQRADSSIIFADSSLQYLAATVVYTAAQPGQIKNRILIMTNASNPAQALLEVPYEASVLHGGIGFEHQQALFVLPVRNVTYYPHPTVQPSLAPDSQLCRYRIDSLDSVLSHQSEYTPKTAPISPTVPSADAPLDSDSDEDCDSSDCEACPCDECDADDVKTVGDGMRDARGNEITASSGNGVEDAADEKDTIHREYHFTNYFSVPISLQLVSVATCGDLMSADVVQSNNVVTSLQKWPPVRLHFHQRVARRLVSANSDLLPFTCWLELWTNVSSHRIPLHIIDGAVKLAYMDAQMIDDLERTGQLSEILTPDNPAVGISTPEPAGRRNSGKTCIPSMPINSDIYHIDMGGLSLPEPRPLRLAFANVNPVRVSVALLNSTVDLCACFDVSWPYGANDERAALNHMLNAADITYAAASKESSCACSKAQKPGKVGDAHSKPAKWGTATAGRQANHHGELPDIPEESRESSKAKFSKSGKTTTVGGWEDPKADEFDGFITQAKAGYNSLFSILLGDLSGEHSAATARGGEAHNSHKRPPRPGSPSLRSELKAEESPVEESPRVLSFSLVSKYQTITAHVHYKPLRGKFVSATRPGSLNWMMGKSNSITITTSSLFKPEDNAHEGFTSQLLPGPGSFHSYRFNYFTSDQVINPQTNLLTWSTTVHPTHICSLFGSSPADVAEEEAGSGDVGGSSGEQMEGQPSKEIPIENAGLGQHSLFTCSIKLLEGLNRSSLQHLRDRLAQVNVHLEQDRNEDAHSEIKLLRNEWTAAFPASGSKPVPASKTTPPVGASAEYGEADALTAETVPVVSGAGIRLSPFLMLVKTQVSHHRHLVDNVTLQSPIALLPENYTIHLPIIGVAQAAAFYIQVHNPFAFPVKFSLTPTGSRRDKKLLDQILTEASDSNVAVSVNASYSFSSAPVPGSPTARPVKSPSQTHTATTGPKPPKSRSKASRPHSRSSHPTSESRSSLGSRESAAGSIVGAAGTGGIIGADGSIAAPSAARRDKDLTKSNTPTNTKAFFAAGASASSPLSLSSNRHKLPVRTFHEYAIVRGASIRLHSLDEATKTRLRSVTNAPDPFIVHSLTSASESVALPFSTTTLGPILYLPHSNKPEIHTANFYVRNNFTGVDMVQVVVETGAPSLVLRGMSVVSNESSLELSLPHDGKNMNRQEMVIQDPAALIRLQVVNEGTVAAVVRDLIVDGRKCSSVVRDSRNGSDIAPIHSPDGTCSSLPREMAPGVPWVVNLAGTTHCHTAVQEHSVIFVLAALDPTGSGSSRSQDGVERDEQYEVLFTTMLSPESRRRCLKHPTSVYAIVTFVAALICVMGFAIRQFLVLTQIRHSAIEKTFTATKLVKARRTKKKTTGNSITSSIEPTQEPPDIVSPPQLQLQSPSVVSLSSTAITQSTPVVSVSSAARTQSPSIQNSRRHQRGHEISAGPPTTSPVDNPIAAAPNKMATAAISPVANALNKHERDELAASIFEPSPLVDSKRAGQEEKATQPVTGMESTSDSANGMEFIGDSISGTPSSSVTEAHLGDETVDSLAKLVVDEQNIHADSLLTELTNQQLTNAFLERSIGNPVPAVDQPGIVSGTDSTSAADGNFAAALAAAATAQEGAEAEAVVAIDAGTDWATSSDSASYGGGNELVLSVSDPSVDLNDVTVDQVSSPGMVSSTHPQSEFFSPYGRTPVPASLEDVTDDNGSVPELQAALNKLGHSIPHAVDSTQTQAGPGPDLPPLTYALGQRDSGLYDFDPLPASQLLDNSYRLAYQRAGSGSGSGSPVRAVQESSNTRFPQPGLLPVSSGDSQDSKRSIFDDLDDLSWAMNPPPGLLHDTSSGLLSVAGSSAATISDSHLATSSNDVNDAAGFGFGFGLQRPDAVSLTSLSSPPTLAGLRATDIEGFPNSQFQYAQRYSPTQGDRARPAHHSPNRPGSGAIAMSNQEEESLFAALSMSMSMSLLDERTEAYNFSSSVGYGGSAGSSSARPTGHAAAAASTFSGRGDEDSWDARSLGVAALVDDASSPNRFTLGYASAGKTPASSPGSGGRFDPSPRPRLDGWLGSPRVTELTPSRDDPMDFFMRGVGGGEGGAGMAGAGAGALTPTSRAPPGLPPPQQARTQLGPMHQFQQPPGFLDSAQYQQIDYRLQAPLQPLQQTRHAPLQTQHVQSAQRARSDQQHAASAESDSDDLLFAAQSRDALESDDER